MINFKFELIYEKKICKYLNALKFYRNWLCKYYMRTILINLEMIIDWSLICY